MAESTLKTGAQTYSAAIETATNYTNWIISRCAPFLGKTILEVGLGHGGYRPFLPASARYIGLDIDAESVARAQRMRPTDTFVAADVTDPGLRDIMAPHHVDTVLCINVLEHIAEDRKAVENLVSILEPGGHLVVLSPAFPALYSSLDSLAGHVKRYVRSDVPPLAPRGSTIVRNEYFNAIGGVGWFLNKLVRHSDLNATAVNSQIVVFDRYVVPVARRTDVLSRRWFGQSLIFVIKKP
jgi:SAM-dependent methyltransferase